MCIDQPGHHQGAGTVDDLAACGRSEIAANRRDALAFDQEIAARDVAELRIEGQQRRSLDERMHAGAPHQSCCGIPDLRTTPFQRSTSEARNFCPWSGVSVCSTTVPRLISRSCTSRRAVAVWIAALSFSTTASGVPFGTASAIQPRALNPGSTVSATVGTSGRPGKRSMVVTARICSLPARYMSALPAGVVKNTGTSPVSIAVCDAVPPL